VKQQIKKNKKINKNQQQATLILNRKIKNQQ
jgi:hypothetical protein